MAKHEARMTDAWRREWKPVRAPTSFPAGREWVHPSREAVSRPQGSLRTAETGIQATGVAERG